MKVVLLSLLFLALLWIITSYLGRYFFRKKTLREVKKTYESIENRDSRPISEEDLKDLPPPLQAYLRYVGVIGKQPLQSARLQMTGTLSMGRGKKKMLFRAEQYYTIRPISFFWLARVIAAPLFIIAGRDKYQNGRGHMLIKLSGLFKLVDAKGKVMDEASLIRYFSEMIWFPTAFLSPNITWEAVDDQSFRGTIRDGDLSVSGHFYIDETGALITFETMRYRDEGGGAFKLRKWMTPILEYEDFDGFRLPSKAQACWVLDDGAFSYIDLEITEWEGNPGRIKETRFLVKS